MPPKPAKPSLPPRALYTSSSDGVRKISPKAKRRAKPKRKGR
jgi:hypothetical protein